MVNRRPDFLQVLFMNCCDHSMLTYSLQRTGIHSELFSHPVSREKSRRSSAAAIGHRGGLASTFAAPERNRQSVNYAVLIHIARTAHEHASFLSLPDMLHICAAIQFRNRAENLGTYKIVVWITYSTSALIYTAAHGYTSVRNTDL